MFVNARHVYNITLTYVAANKFFVIVIKNLNWNRALQDLSQIFNNSYWASKDYDGSYQASLH